MKTAPPAPRDPQLQGLPRIRISISTGRHLLVYGPNGSGKSLTILGALHVPPKRPQIDAQGVHCQVLRPSRHASTSSTSTSRREAAPTARRDRAHIARVRLPRTDTTYRISQTVPRHPTPRQPTILKGDLASDFITYRFFFGGLLAFPKLRRVLTSGRLFRERRSSLSCVSTAGRGPARVAGPRSRSGRPESRSESRLGWHIRL